MFAPRFHIVVIVLIAIVYSRCWAVEPAFPQQEYDALRDLYFSTGGSNWDWRNLSVGSVVWQFDTPANPCADKWQGLVCANHGSIPDFTSNVVEIDLPKRNLSGPIPHTISSLTYLASVLLPENHINGTLPSTLGSLRYLNHLEINYNDITGTIPVSLGNISGLNDLVLEFNSLSGPLPAWSNMSTLRNILLSYNHLSGTLPPEMGNWQRLTWFYAYGNNLEGSLPPSLGNLTRLYYLDLDVNRFTGTLPSTLEALTDLHFFGIHDNFISGTIPEYIGNMTGLQFLYLNNALFTGTIPDLFGQLIILNYLEISDNYLSGTVPASLGRIRRLEQLHLEDNMLTGTLSPQLSHLLSLNTLQAQNNFLTGPITGVFNHTFQVNLVTVELSNNKFTGSLPSELFLIPTLTTLIVITSCIGGTIPVEVCGSKRMEALILDSLYAGAPCNGGDTLQLRDSFQGTIPMCLFDLPLLNTLHLSGNGLSGSLASNLTVSSALLNLDLSHNRLTSTIPSAIQRNIWYNLDLSYNRLSGSLEPGTFTAPRDFVFHYDSQQYTFNYTAPASTAALSVSNNRLSGPVPHSVTGILNISILSANLFSCAPDKHDLPTYDAADSTYACASESFDFPYYAMLCGISLAVALALCAWYVQLLSSARLAVAQRYLTITQDTVGYPNMTKAATVLSTAVRSAAYSLVYILVVLLPVYAACTAAFGTHTRQYTYTVSAIFISGAVPFALEVVALVVLVGLFVKFAQPQRDVGEDQESRMSRSSSTQSVVSLVDGRCDEMAVRLAGVCVLFVLFNVVVVVGINAAFVYASLYASTAVLTIAQILLCFFKILWNSWCLPIFMQWALQQIQGHAHAAGDSGTSVVRESASDAFFPLQLFVALLNNIAIPCLVVVAIDPNCFRDLLVKPQSETARFLYAYCDTYGINGCLTYGPALSSVPYDPPFTYSYQCSSSFITYYSPAFLYMCITVVFVSPLLQSILQVVHQHTVQGSVARRLLERCMTKLLRPPQGKSLEGAKRNTASYSISTVMVTLLSYVAVLLSYGAIFPPLAAAVAVAIVCAFYYERLLLGRFVTLATEVNRTALVAGLERECRLFVHNVDLMLASRMIVYFCCGFYTLFLFDTLGDAEGFASSAWVLIVVPVAPWVVFALYDVVRSVRGWGELREGREDSSVSSNDVELQARGTTAASLNGATCNDSTVGEQVHSVLHSNGDATPAIA